MSKTESTDPTQVIADSGAGHPAARRVAAATNLETSPEHAPDPKSQLGTDPPVGRIQPVGKRLSPQLRRHILSHLSDRDRSILLGLAAHRHLTTTQIQRLYFDAHKSSLAAARATSRVLGRLHDQQLVMRLERRVGGFAGGSRAFIWGVTDTGEKAIGDLKNVPGKRRRYDQPSTHHLDHVLAITDARLELIEADRAGAFTIIKTQLEPDCWRPYLNRHGQPTHLKPDLFAITQTPDFEDHWMIEVDRDTEHLPAVIRKCQAVQLYHDRGIEQQKTGVFPVTVWVVPDETRRHKIETVILKTVDLSSKLFRVVEMKDLAALIASGGGPDNHEEGGIQ